MSNSGPATVDKKRGQRVASLLQQFAIALGQGVQKGRESRTKRRPTRQEGPTSACFGLLPTQDATTGIDGVRLLSLGLVQTLAATSSQRRAHPPRQCPDGRQDQGDVAVARRPKMPPRVAQARRRIASETLAASVALDFQKLRRAGVLKNSIATSKLRFPRPCRLRRVGFRPSLDQQAEAGGGPGQLGAQGERETRRWVGAAPTAKSRKVVRPHRSSADVNLRGGAAKPGAPSSAGHAASVVHHAEMSRRPPA